MWWFSSKPKNISRKNWEVRYHLHRSRKWSYLMLSSDVLIICFVFLHRLRYKFIYLTNVSNLENYQCSSWMKKWKTVQSLCSDLDFQTDHLLLDSIITLHTLMFFTWRRTDHNRELCALLFNEWCVGSLTSHRVEIRKICETESHVYGPKKSLPFAGVVTKAALSPQLLLWTRTPAWVTEPQVPSYTHWLTHSLTVSDRQNPDDIVHYGLARKHKNGKSHF